MTPIELGVASTDYPDGSPAIASPLSRTDVHGAYSRSTVRGGDRWQCRARPDQGAAIDVSATPGWYPEPDDPSRMRFWDGSAWTGQRTWNGSGWVESALAPAPPTRKRNPL